jgi:hypothetical protein
MRKRKAKLQARPNSEPLIIEPMDAAFVFSAET